MKYRSNTESGEMEGGGGNFSDWIYCEGTQGVALPIDGCLERLTVWTENTMFGKMTGCMVIRLAS